VLYPPADLAGAAGGLDEDGYVPLDYGGYLLLGTDGSVVLVDVGGGKSSAAAEDSITGLMPAVRNGGRSSIWRTAERSSSTWPRSPSGTPTLSRR
jgi:hypothetical protein